jgi:hypothetical protein
MAIEQKDMDISEMKESLGTIMASFTYIYDPYAIIKEIDIIMSFESAMLDVKGEWTKQRWPSTNGIEVDTPSMGNRMGDYLLPTPKQQVTKRKKVKVTNYRELFGVFRWWWESAVDSWNSQTGNWKDSIIICSKLRSDLMRIALKEGLVSLTSSMYTIQMRGAQAPAGGEFFDSEVGGGGPIQSGLPGNSPK